MRNTRRGTCISLWGIAQSIFRIPIAGGNAELAADTKGVPYTGSLGLWFGLDATDTPLLLRDAGTQDVYALSLERK